MAENVVRELEVAVTNLNKKLMALYGRNSELQAEVDMVILAVARVKEAPVAGGSVAPVYVAKVPEAPAKVAKLFPPKVTSA
jgi:hypothetical protein